MGYQNVSVKKKTISNDKRKILSLNIIVALLLVSSNIITLYFFWDNLFFSILNFFKWILIFSNAFFLIYWFSNKRRVFSFISAVAIMIELTLQFTDISLHHQSSLSYKSFPPNPIEKQGWTLTMHDEFNGTQLDTNLWIPFYIRQRSLKDIDVYASFIFEDGCLVLQRFKNGTSSIQSIEYSNLISKGIRKIPTKVNFEQQYGYFEIRAKTQKGLGHNSAFWLMGSTDDSTKSAEIDIVEQAPKFGNNVVATNLHTWKDTALFNKIKKKNFQQKFSSTQDLTESFNIYGLEWAPNQLKYYLNNELIAVIPFAPKYKMGILLSLYQNPNSWMGQLDKKINYPKSFYIDYVRVYKRN